MELDCEEDGDAGGEDCSPLAGACGVPGTILGRDRKWTVDKGVPRALGPS